ncbi:unnamed protein product [Phyllotreta striolata]|uniref:Ribosomal protein L1 n=1 Tax=Phyllotreta striolata TaxID=444603 RepID=A0A9N9U229_PHYSR|nr:unnamed protein product [Phyllotreta striolata]
MGKIKKDSNISKSTRGTLLSIKSPTLRKKSSSKIPAATKLKNKSKIANLVISNLSEETDKIVNIKRKNDKQSEPRNASFENQFNIKLANVKNAVEGVIKLHTNNPKVKNNLFEEEAFGISLMVNCHKIPNGKQKLLRIPLKHSLLTPDSDVCLIVSEVKDIGNKEHDKHIAHYEKLLADKGVENIKKIITVHELKTEYETFEQKQRLADLYDSFLVCGKVSGKVVKWCGKIFYKKRKVPTPVKLNAKNLKEHIDVQLSKSFFHIHLKGDCYFADIGTSHMDAPKIVENFVSAVEFLDKEFPGGFQNIKGLHVKSVRAASIPVYVSVANPKDIPEVRTHPKNSFALKPVKGEVTTVLDAEVLVKPSGRVRVLRENQSEGNKPAKLGRKKLKTKAKKEQVKKEESSVETKKIKKEQNHVKVEVTLPKKRGASGKEQTDENAAKKKKIAVKDELTEVKKVKKIKKEPENKKVKSNENKIKNNTKKVQHLGQTITIKEVSTPEKITTGAAKAKKIKKPKKTKK